MTNFLLQAALASARRGWLVVPLHAPLAHGCCTCEHPCGVSAGKHPRTPHGFYDASSQADQIARWWRRWPHANVGIRTGKASGLVVLDVDARHGGETSLETLQTRYGALPPTLTASSGGGGQHLYFHHPVPRLPNSTEMGGYAGLDVRADGGYIVAPPSLHRSGQPYRWQEPASPLAILPDWLSALLTSKPIPARPLPPRLAWLPETDRPQFWLRLALERAHPGLRNVTGYWLACRLRDAGCTQAEAEAVLLNYAAQVAVGEHPYTSREAIASVHSAYHHLAQEPISTRATRA
jgi:hypothetical protein